jgi:hypothetical protein
MAELRTRRRHAAADLPLDQQLDVRGALGVAVAAEPHHVPQVIQPQVLRAPVVGSIEKRAMVGRTQHHHTALTGTPCGERACQWSTSA